MKMNEVKSVTWTKLAEIKTNAKTTMEVYKVICNAFDVDLFEDVFAVEVAIRNGNIQICDDGFIIWGSWKDVNEIEN